jgi:hypothetical protein
LAGKIYGREISFLPENGMGGDQAAWYEPPDFISGVRTTVSRSITFFFWESDLLEKEAIRSNKERIAPKTFDMNSCVLSRTDVLMTTL